MIICKTIYKKRFIGLVSLALSLWLGGCNQSNSNPSVTEDKPKVVSTSTIITDWTQQVGGDEIELLGILQPGADPHVYEPVPQDSQAFEEADLILYNGYNLEPNLIKLMNAAGVKAEKFAVGEVVSPLDFNYDNQTVPDPHVWGNVANAVTMVEAIRDRLIELSPEDEVEFRENATQLISELEKLHIWIGEQTATIPVNQRKLVTTHDAFQYYAQAYQLKIIGTLIGISTEEKPSAKTVQKLVEAVKQSGVPAIFAETTINPALITTVAQEAGVKLAANELYADSIGAPGSDGDSYIKMMVVNTRTIVEALGGNYSEFISASQSKN